MSNVINNEDGHGTFVEFVDMTVIEHVAGGLYRLIKADTGLAGSPAGPALGMLTNIRDCAHTC